MKLTEFGWLKINDHSWNCLDNCTNQIVGSVTRDPYNFDKYYVWEVRLPYPLCVSNRFPAGKAKTEAGAKQIVETICRETLKEVKDEQDTERT